MTNPANPPDFHPSGPDGSGSGRSGPRSGGRLERQRIAAARVRQQRRRTVALALFAATVGLVLVALVQSRPGGPGADLTVAAGRDGTAAGASAGRSGPRTDPGAEYPTTGPGTFGYAGGGPVLGAGGSLRRYRVAVEQGMGQDVGAFAAAVDAILGDPRGWTAGKRHRFQRVAKSTKAEFTVFLATPGTSEKMCATGGLHTERFNSCRLPGQVIVNVGRWLAGVPDYGAPLEVYQAYAVNHEVGHELGQGHQGCPRPGAPAPVMQQQTYGLKGCAPNGWPYVDGKSYAGPPIP
ncbi:DUF3152 domain-containing protein [Plantactinospora sp. CA-290183]|uniref:DUF3152 domain-containing protein n=1 Tax=Plantactinospora sp. CA-290183 TaxID=3240006 RepID=UPI003D8F9E2D